MQDFKEIIKAKQNELDKINIKRNEIVGEIKQLSIQEAEVYKTEELITFLDKMVENNCVLKESNSFIILDNYRFYDNCLHLKGKSLTFNEDEIGYCRFDSIGFDLNENTIEEIFKTTISVENQLFIKNTLKNYLGFCEKLSKGEVR